MNTLSALLAHCGGNDRLAVDSLHKGPMMQSVDGFVVVILHEIVN